MKYYLSTHLNPGLKRDRHIFLNLWYVYVIFNLPWETDEVGTDTETCTGASGNG